VVQSAHDAVGGVVRLDQERHRERVLAGQRRAHEAGVDDVHQHPGPVQIEFQRLRHGNQRRLGGRIGNRGGQAAIPGHRGHNGQLPPPARDQPRHHGGQCVAGADQVHVHLQLERGAVEILR
jgi:hypothetical protein